jgi:hypothetical protein
MRRDGGSVFPALVKTGDPNGLSKAYPLMRADIHDGPEHRLQPKAGYIDARPLTASSLKSPCNARPDHTFGSNTGITRGPYAFARKRSILRHRSKAARRHGGLAA